MPTVHLRTRVLERAPSPIEALACLRDARRPILLEGPSGTPSRHAWLLVDPLETFDGARDLGAVRAALEGHRFAGARPSGPFAGGFAGSLAYDLGPAGERLDLPADPWGWPLVLGGVYASFVHWDLERGRTEVVAPGAAELEHLVGRLSAVPPAPGPAPRIIAPLERTTDAAAHAARVELAREAIADGAYYQANLSHRLVCRVRADALDLYRALRRANPAPYMAFLEHERGAILSSSPELLLDFDGSTATSRPIKGTAPRAVDPREDEERARALLSSAKDRAELAMIVDLVRNDLGRVARVGGVRVEELARLETYAHVHHLVATVAARVRGGVDAFDVLDVLFPGGSITGAPKLASMRAIAALEGEGRGPFTGSLGWIGADGRACFNILIRTLLTRPVGTDVLEVSFRVGGGVTWRSDPWAEDAETMHKARGLVRALEEGAP